MSLLSEGPALEPSEQSMPIDFFSEHQTETRVTKSRLRTLFSWAPGTAEQQITPTPDHKADTADSLRYQNNSQKSAQLQRSQSDYFEPQRPSTRISPRSRRYRRSSITNLLNPVPLSQAQSQASFQSIVQLPTKTLLDGLSSKLGRHRTGSIARAHSSSSAVRPISPQEARNMHHQDDANPTASFSDKLMILCSYGQMLQYEVEGASDRLPEKVFSLSRQSSAFASDVIPGKYWVLEISDVEDQTESGPPKSSRSPWSVFASRNNDATTRKSTSLLLVFDNPDVMQTCLTNVRTEISLVDCLRPLSESSASDCVVKLSALRHSSSERMALRSSFLRFSRSSSNLLHEASPSSKADKELPSLPTTLLTQSYVPAPSVAASSVGTKTSLDKFRDADSGSTTTATTNSLDGLSTGDSPTKLMFSGRPLVSLVDDVSSGALVQHVFDERSLSRDFYSQRESSTMPTNNLGNSNNGISTADEEKRDSGESFMQSSRGTEDDFRLSTARFSTILPLFPNPEKSGKRSPVRSSFSEERSTEAIVTEPSRPATSHARHTSKLSTDAGLKSSYSLFPKRFAKEVKVEPLVIPETNHIPGLPYNYATDHLDLPLTPAPMREPLRSTTPTRLSAKKPMALKLLSIQDMEPAQRSPAVTEDMLASNFGTSSLKWSHSPVTPSRSQVPNFDDLKIDFSILGITRQPSLTESYLSSSDSQANPLRRTRSISNLPNSQAPSAPVGPPPSGPLPAVPLQNNPIKSVDSKQMSSQTRYGSAKGIPSTSKRSSNSSNTSDPQTSIARARGKSCSDKTFPKRDDNMDCTHVETTRIMSDISPEPSVGTVSIVYSSKIGNSKNDRQGHRHGFRTLGDRNNDALRNNPRANLSSNGNSDTGCSSLGTMNLPKMELPVLCDVAFGFEEENKKYDKFFAGF